MFALLLPAAGSGTRFGRAGRDKLLADLAGQSVLQRAVALFANRRDIAVILIVTAPDRFNPYQHHLGPLIPPHVPLHFTPGGRERWESVLFGLRYLANLASSPLAASPSPRVAASVFRHVAIHDAARPLTPVHVIDAAFKTALEKNAALPAVPEPATLKKANPDQTIAATIDRKNLYQAQTPQCFHLQTLLRSYEHLLEKDQLKDVTDDAQVFERTPLPVPLTPGDPLNLKITTPSDVTLARAILNLEPR
jgi:2-C-methyl-D-erythritol 4-phosphate cytidylyltransferase